MTSIDYQSILDIAKAIQPTYIGVNTDNNNEFINKNHTINHMNTILNILELQSRYHTLYHHATLQSELTTFNALYSTDTLLQHMTVIKKLNQFLNDIIESTTSITATRHNTRSLYQVLTQNTHSTIQHIYIHPQNQKLFIDLLNNIRYDISIQNTNLSSIQYINKINIDLTQCDKVLNEITELIEIGVTDVDTINKLHTALQQYCISLQQHINTGTVG